MSAEGKPVATITAGVAIYVTTCLEVVGEKILQEAARVVERDNSDEASARDLYAALTEDEMLHQLVRAMEVRYDFAAALKHGAGPGAGLDAYSGGGGGVGANGLGIGSGMAGQGGVNGSGSGGAGGAAGAGGETASVFLSSGKATAKPWQVPDSATDYDKAAGSSAAGVLSRFRRPTSRLDFASTASSSAGGGAGLTSPTSFASQSTLFYPESGRTSVMSQYATPSGSIAHESEGRDGALSPAFSGPGPANFGARPSGSSLEDAAPAGGTSNSNNNKRFSTETKASFASGLFGNVRRRSSFRKDSTAGSQDPLAARQQYLEQPSASGLPSGVPDISLPADPDDDFEALMLSGQTMKVSLTPNRLRTIEVAQKEAEAEAKRSAARRRPGLASPSLLAESESASPSAGGRSPIRGVRSNSIPVPPPSSYRMNEGRQPSGSFSFHGASIQEDEASMTANSSDVSHQGFRAERPPSAASSSRRLEARSETDHVAVQRDLIDVFRRGPPDGGGGGGGGGSSQASHSTADHTGHVKNRGSVGEKMRNMFSNRRGPRDSVSSTVSGSSKSVQPASVDSHPVSSQPSPSLGTLELADVGGAAPGRLPSQPTSPTSSRAGHAAAAGAVGGAGVALGIGAGLHALAEHRPSRELDDDSSLVPPAPPSKDRQSSADTAIPRTPQLDKDSSVDHALSKPDTPVTPSKVVPWSYHSRRLSSSATQTSGKRGSQTLLPSPNDAALLATPATIATSQWGQTPSSPMTTLDMQKHASRETVRSLLELEGRMRACDTVEACRMLLRQMIQAEGEAGGMSTDETRDQSREDRAMQTEDAAGSTTTHEDSKAVAAWLLEERVEEQLPAGSEDATELQEVEEDTRRHSTATSDASVGFVEAPEPPSTLPA